MTSRESLWWLFNNFADKTIILSQACILLSRPIESRHWNRWRHQQQVGSPAWESSSLWHGWWVVRCVKSAICSLLLENTCGCESKVKRYCSCQQVPSWVRGSPLILFWCDLLHFEGQQTDTQAWLLEQEEYSITASSLSLYHFAVRELYRKNVKSPRNMLRHQRARGKHEDSKSGRNLVYCGVRGRHKSFCCCEWREKWAHRSENLFAASHDA